MDYFKKISEIVADQLGITPDTITRETTFGDLDADSLDVVEVIMALEDEFGTEIPSEDLEKLNTVGDVMNYLTDKGVE